MRKWAMKPFLEISKACEVRPNIYTMIYYIQWTTIVVPDTVKTNTAPKDTKKCKGNIIWFNPPFSKNVATNIGKTFLRILENKFPRAHSLRKLFNKDNVKLSYSCVANTGQIIGAHNKRSLTKQQDETTSENKWNCRNKTNCPQPDRCLSKSVGYQATVNTTDNRPPLTYVG